MPGPYRTFRERFCETFICPADAFESRALWELVDPLPRFFGRCVALLHPQALETDRTILRRVAHLDTVPDVLRAVQDLEKEYVVREDFGPLRRFLKVRLSRERVLRLTAQLWRRDRLRAT